MKSMTGIIRFVWFGGFVRFDEVDRSLLRDTIDLDCRACFYRLDDALEVVVLEAEDDVRRARLQCEPVAGGLDDQQVLEQKS